MAIFQCHNCDEQARVWPFGFGKTECVHCHELFCGRCFSERSQLKLCGSCFVICYEGELYPGDWGKILKKKSLIAIARDVYGRDFGPGTSRSELIQRIDILRDDQINANKFKREKPRSELYQQTKNVTQNQQTGVKQRADSHCGSEIEAESEPEPNIEIESRPVAHVPRKAYSNQPRLEDIEAVEDVDAFNITQLKHILNQKNIHCSDCLEKLDLIDRVKIHWRAMVVQEDLMQPGPSSSFTHWHHSNPHRLEDIEAVEQIEILKTSQLLDILKQKNIDYSDCVERPDLIDRVIFHWKVAMQIATCSAVKELNLDPMPGPSSSFTQPHYSDQPRLEDIQAVADIDSLSVRQLRHILQLKNIDFSDCIERLDLIDRVIFHWKMQELNAVSSVSNPRGQRTLNQLKCKICLNKMIDSVFYPCKHTACKDCSYKLGSYHVCRQNIERVDSFFV